MKTKYYTSGLFLLLFFFSVSTAEAAFVDFKIKEDKTKRYQWRSMETGKWDFKSSLWYATMHRNYSGYSWGKFKESKSNVKTLMPRRLTELGTQEQRNMKVDYELAAMDSVFRMESAAALDREIDIHYSSYEHEFNDMQSAIRKYLEISMLKSNGEYKEQIDDIAMRNDLLCDNIGYIHKSGYGYELENAKRQEAYDNAKREMTKILNEAYLIARRACIMYYRHDAE